MLAVGIFHTLILSVRGYGWGGRLVGDGVECGVSKRGIIRPVRPTQRDSIHPIHKHTPVENLLPATGLWACSVLVLSRR